jgi:hypothetical protein
LSRFLIYVDESGDRVWGSRTSGIFVLSAAIVREEERPEVEEALDGIVAALGKPRGTTLRWSGNLRRAEQRVEACARLVEAPVRLTNVVVLKAAIHGADPSPPHPALLYCDALLRLLERALWYVADRGGEAGVTLARVTGFGKAQLDAVLSLGRSMSSKIHWDVLDGITTADPWRVRPLQVAGVASGALHDAFGDSELAPLVQLAPIIDVRGRGAVSSWGVVMVGPTDHVAAAYPWWPEMAALIERRQPPPRPRP